MRTIGASVVVTLVLASCTSGTDEADKTARSSGLRPLELQKLDRGETCPTSPTQVVVENFAPVPGNGPVYPTIFDPVRVPLAEAGADGWYAIKILWIGRPDYDGTVVVRGGRIDAKGAVKFEGDGSRLELLPERYAHGSWPGAALGWRDWPSVVRVRGQGCYALQVDTKNGSETIVFRAVRDSQS
jgi:hypothetical protein